MCVCVCVCVCVCERAVRLCVCVCMHACARVCISAWHKLCKLPTVIIQRVCKL